MRQPQRRRQAGSGKGFFAGVGEAFSRFFGFLESRAWREGLVNLLQMLVAFTGTFMLVFDPLRKTVAQLLKVEPSTSIGFDIKVTGLVFIVLAVIANFMEFFELRGRIVHVRGEKEELVDNLYIVLVLGSAWVSNFTVNVADPSSTHKMLVLLTAGYGLLQLVWIIFTAGGGEEEERPL